jgi:tRNA(Ile)-lysidine synthetase-like protein
MIRILGKIPQKVTVACSGGIDSMAVVHFLLQGKRDVSLAYFDHNTAHSRKAQSFVTSYAKKNNLKLEIGKVKGFKGKKSLEEFWRDERYSFFNKLDTDFLITCHHLDDCVETWLMTSFHGRGRLIPYQRSSNIYRPFLLTDKRSILSYADRKEVKWVEDPTNQHTNFMRNHVRKNIIPEVLKVNPGIRKTIRKKLLELYVK